MYAGLDFKFAIGATVVAGCETTSVTFPGAPIETTNKSSLGFSEFMDAVDTKSIEISFDGVTKDAVLRVMVADPTASRKIAAGTITFADGGTITGAWVLMSYDENGAHNEAVKFSASLKTDGAYVYTAPI